MPPLNESELRGKAYWRSLDEIADTPEFRRFMHHEFPAGAAELLDSASRRHFLKIMSASMALAGLGLGGCRRWPEEAIAPYANRPPRRTPGDPVHYASCMPVGATATALLVTSVDGRPIKLEGNPEHPEHVGGTSVFGQASVLNLYDPDRSRAVRQGGEPSSWDQFKTGFGDRLKQLKNRKGAGLFVLSEATSSPSAIALKQELLDAFPRMSWHEYEPLNNDSEVEGTELAFGAPARPHYDLSKARVIVSLDADFLFDHADALHHIRGFAAGRRAMDPAKTMNRLYCFESTSSLTGANADHRTAMRSADVAVVAAWLAARIIGGDALLKFEQHEAARSLLSEEALNALEHALTDLQSNRGEGLVIAGRRQPAEVHMLAHVMNYSLGNLGSTTTYSRTPDATAQMDSMRKLAAAMASGAVDTLVILGGNPVYDAPADLNFAEHLRTKVRHSVHLSDYVDETSQLCEWHVNRAHYLEAWGDGRGYGGTLSIGQPMILPLFGGRSAIELLAFLSGDDLADGFDIVQRTFQEMTGATDPKQVWRRTLHDGWLSGSAFTREALRARREAVPDAARALFDRWSALDRTRQEVVFTTDYRVYDGRFANNGWLQEVPDPLTKLTWDNAVIMGVRAAEQLGVETGDMVQVTVGQERSVRAAVFVLPGQADDSLTLPLGYGRQFAGRICQGSGFDFYALRTSAAPGFAGGATVQKIDGRYPLATTQDHHAIDVETVGGTSLQNRLPSLFRAASLQEYREHPEFASHRTHVLHRLSLWDDQKYLRGAPYAWGMSIDLTSCVGCNACIVACQAENNIPIVGKDQVMRGREMHWLRVDRYFRFEPDENGGPNRRTPPAVALQPVLCMMCENAPCEQVCPVAATVHDKDGLNVMVYNRCVGTRYCSNNCPYKVRRFNYFDFQRREPYRQPPGVLLAVKPNYYVKPQAAAEPLKQLQLNPEVTVRVRGVMEKCTYCVQRIQAAKIKAKNQWVKLAADDPAREQTRVPVEDGAVVTACQQACPANAIVFGDLNDPDSRVARLQRHERSYEMLEELNTKPRTKYLAKLWNPAYGASAAEATSH